MWHHTLWEGHPLRAPAALYSQVYSSQFTLINGNFVPQCHPTYCNSHLVVYLSSCVASPAHGSVLCWGGRVLVPQQIVHIFSQLCIQQRHVDSLKPTGGPECMEREEESTPQNSANKGICKCYRWRLSCTLTNPTPRELILNICQHTTKLCCSYFVTLVACHGHRRYLVNISWMNEKTSLLLLVDILFPSVYLSPDKAPPSNFLSPSLATFHDTSCTL